MESLDTYIEKRKKLTDTITKQLDKAKALSMEHNSLGKQLKFETPRHTDITDSKFFSEVTSTAKMKTKFDSRPRDQHTMITDPIQQPILRKEQSMVMYEEGS